MSLMVNLTLTTDERATNIAEQFGQTTTGAGALRTVAEVPSPGQPLRHYGEDLEPKLKLESSLNLRTSMNWFRRLLISSMIPREGAEWVSGDANTLSGVCRANKRRGNISPYSRIC